jgi:nitrite reductase/ring-hydroxylating ferredoxin subunit
MTTVLCHIDAISNQSSKGFSRQGIGYFVVKKNNQVFVYRNQCPHLGVELNWQEDQFLDVDGMLIQCSTHGAQFIIEDGQCVAGPCLGEKLQAIPFDIINGMICLSS